MRFSRFLPRSAKKKKRFSPKKKKAPKHFRGKICSTVDILMLDIGSGRESDSADEEDCRSHCESITGAITQGVDVIVIE